MTGVEILSSTIFYKTILPEWVFIITFVGIFCFFVSTLFCLLEGKKLLTVIFLIMTIISIILTTLTTTFSDTIDHIKYKVIIEDSVSMNEFYEYYEVIEQEGKIFTVRERINNG
jgi:hypothetical protein